MRFKLTLLALILAFGGFAVWLYTHPDEAACAAAGRIVDVTHRYCITDTGSVLLREHIQSHAMEPTFCIPAVGTAVLALLVAATWDRRKRK